MRANTVETAAAYELAEALGEAVPVEDIQLYCAGAHFELFIAQHSFSAGNQRALIWAPSSPQPGNSSGGMIVQAPDNAQVVARGRSIPAIGEKELGLATGAKERLGNG